MDRNTACVHRCKRRKKKKISRDPTNATRCFMPRARDPATLDATALFPFADGSSPPPFPSSLSSWLHAAGRGTTRDRRLILSRVNRRDRFRVPARREAAARYWPRFFHVLHASVQTPGDWKVGGRWRKWNRVDFSPSLSLFASPLLLKLQIFLFDQSGRNSLILLEKLIVKRHLFKNVFH